SAGRAVAVGGRKIQAGGVHRLGAGAVRDVGHRGGGWRGRQPGHLAAVAAADRGRRVHRARRPVLAHAARVLTTARGPATAAQASPSWAIQSPASGVWRFSLSGIAPEVARRRATVARPRPGNLAADGEERPLTSPRGRTSTPLRRLHLFG